MNILKTIDQYDNNSVYFCDPIKNNIMLNSTFIRILYSTPYFSLNGVYITLNITYTNIDKYFNKYKCSFDINAYKDLIEQIKVIEENLLDKYKYKCNKTAHCRIYEQLKCGNIKVFSENLDKNNIGIYLKIAGIWETDTEYGLTYKFIVSGTSSWVE